MSLQTKILRMATVGLIAAGLVGAAAPVVASAAPASATAPTSTAAASATLSAEKFTGIKRKFLSRKWAQWMHTSVTLEGTTLYGVTTLDGGDLSGFTGCVKVLYRNSANTVIGSSPEHCWGVAGRAEPNAPNHRVETWNAAVPANVAAATTALDIQQYQS
ncbi:MAG TPA: hypothetical protein VNV66_11755 [Pilimelia sp.]|nr:hypothetical protein [Pilimelia sp.]